MLQWLVEGALRLRFLVVGLAAMLVVAAAVQLRHQPTDVLPEFSAPYAEIQTEALGLSAEEVEQMITVPLEADLLNGVAWLQSIESASVTGMSSIVLTFEPGTDVIRARQMVQERLTQAHALPNVSQPPVLLQPLSSTNRLTMIGMTSNEVSLIDMSVLARWVIRPRLMGVPGVANVAIWGLRDRQLQVLVDPERLGARDVALWDVVKATGEALWVSPLTFLNSSTPGTGGFIDTPNQRLGVRHVLPVSSPSDLGRIAVSGTPWALADVSNVVEGHQPLVGDAIVNGAPGLVLVVEKFPWADTVTVSRAVDDVVAALRPGLSGIAVDSTLFRPSSYIETARGNLARSLAIGLAAALVLLAFLLRNVLRLVVAGATLIVSLAAALWILSLIGAAMNAMVLLGLLGAGVVIVGEAVIGAAGGRRVASRQDVGSEGAPSQEPLPVEVFGGVTYGAVISLLVLVPALTVGGVTGALLRPLVLAFAVGVLASALAAMTLAPALSSLLLAPGRRDRGAPPVSTPPPARAYRRVVASLMRRPLALLAGSAVLAAAGIVGAAWLRPALMPTLHEQDVVVSLTGVPGMSHPEMVRVVQRLGDRLEGVPGVAGVTTQVGRAVTGDTIVDVNEAKLWVRLGGGVDHAATLAALRNVADGYPGLDGRVTTYLGDRLERAAPAVTSDLVVRVYGNDLALLEQTAATVADRVRDVNGLHDVAFASAPSEPAIAIQVDLARAQRYGLKPGDVRRAATSLVNGIQVGSVFEAQKVFDVVIRGELAVRDSPSDLPGLLIDTPSGQRVRLGDVADVHVLGAPALIRRDAVSRYLDVTAQVSTRRIGDVVARTESALATVAFPLEFHAEVLTPALERQRLASRLVVLGGGVALAVLLLLQAAFASWRLAAIAWLLLLGGASGGVGALLIAGGSASLAALAGFVALFGLGVRLLLLVLRRAQREQQAKGNGRSEAALEASSAYVVPVVAIAVAIAAMVLPALLAGARPGTELIRETASVLLGGLVTTTALVLLGAPVLYGRFDRTSVDELDAPFAWDETMGRSQDATP